MKRKLFTPEQVIRILREAETSKLSVRVTAPHSTQVGHQRILRNQAP